MGAAVHKFPPKQPVKQTEGPDEDKAKIKAFIRYLARTSAQQDYEAANHTQSHA